jgi:hypothetical protein
MKKSLLFCFALLGFSSFAQDREGLSFGLDAGLMYSPQLQYSPNGLQAGLSSQYQLDNFWFLDYGFLLALHNGGAEVPYGMLNLDIIIGPYFGVGIGNKVDGLAASIAYVYSVSTKLHFVMTSNLFFYNWYLRYTHKFLYFDQISGTDRAGYVHWSGISLGYSFYFGK